MSAILWYVCARYVCILGMYHGVRYAWTSMVNVSLLLLSMTRAQFHKGLFALILIVIPPLIRTQILMCHDSSPVVTYLKVLPVCIIVTKEKLWLDDVIKWKHHPSYWPFVRGIHRSPVNSPHKGQWRGALMFSLICTWNNTWANSGDASDLRRHLAHYDVIVMEFLIDYVYEHTIPLCKIDAVAFERWPSC